MGRRASRPYRLNPLRRLLSCSRNSAATTPVRAAPADAFKVMERMGHSQIQTTQKYLHTLPDTDQRNLDALSRIQNRRH